MMKIKIDSIRPFAASVVLVLCLLIAMQAATAQSPRQVVADIAPAFRIEPLVVQTSARPGQVVPFQFQMSAQGKPVRMQVSVVGLVQAPSGQIRIAQEAAPDGVRILSEQMLDVQSGERVPLRGEVRIPGHTSYLAFGLLVTDMGEPTPASQVRSDGAEGTQMAVRYVTRYLLRVEVQIHGGKGATVSDLQVSEGSLLARDGHAVVRAVVDNPAATAVGFGARARLYRGEDEHAVPIGPYFQLGHPIRANEQGPQKYEVRALSESQLHLEAPVPEPVFPGPYQLEVQLLNERRMVAARQRFPLTVAEDDFPAQRAVVARVVNTIHVARAHVELSLRSAGQRMATLSIENSGAEAVSVKLIPQPFGDSDADWVSVRPAELEMRGGTKRGVMVTVDRRSLPEDAATRYALINVEVQPLEGGAGGSQQIPVALTAGDATAAVAEIGDWQWNEARSVILLPVSNKGERHLAMNGRLTLADDFGRGLQLEAGYGRWLLPGDETVLRFVLPRTLPPGTYQLSWQLQTTDDADPKEWREQLVVP